jgi:ABC-2 type transport system permease protein
MYVVFVKILNAGAGIPHFGVYLLLGIVIWSYFTEVTMGSISAIVGRGDLLRKVNFPSYVIILAGSFSALINLCFNLAVVGIFMVLARTEVTAKALPIVPLLILELFVFSLSVGFLLSALYVKFRDIGFIWEVAMQGAFFATPIMYSYTLITSKNMVAAKILMCNPITQLMQGMRYILITPKTTTIGDVFGTAWAVLIPLTIVAVISLAAVIYFKRRSPYFAEEV